MHRFSQHLKTIAKRLPVHWLFAFLVAMHGYLLVQQTLPTAYRLFNTTTFNHLAADNAYQLLDSVALSTLFSLILGSGLLINAVGLLLRARTAWLMSLFLLSLHLLYIFIYSAALSKLEGYTFLLIILLLAYGRRFNRSSLASGSLFAVVGLLLLLVYAVIGSLYLGKDYTPPITNLNSAFYFSIVAMSTVGFGDIVPTTVASRLFTTSIIILGITIFATSVSAVIGPLISGHFDRILKGSLHKTMKKDHIIIVGSTALAQSVYAALEQVGQALIVIVPPNTEHNYPEGADILVGDATDTAVLNQAYASRARYVLALREDDSENAFIVLAAKEAGSTQTRTVALVNNSIHLNKIKQVNPDIVLSLQSLGAELLTRVISGQPITDSLITQLLFPLEKKNS